MLEDIRGALKFFNARFQHYYFPLQVVLQITNRCNLKCNYCFGNFPYKNKDELSTKDIFDIVDQLKKLGTERIAVTGGEPLLREDIREILAYIKENGFYCSIATNGYLVYKYMNIISKLNHVVVSIDGPETINDELRGKGSYKQAIKAIELCNSCNVPVILAVTLTNRNVGYFDWIFDFAKKYSCRVSFCTLLNIFENGKKTPIDKLLISDSVYPDFLNKLINLKRKGEPLVYSIEVLKHILRWPTSFMRENICGDELSKYSDYKPVRCSGGRYFCYIDEKGNIYPCRVTLGHLTPYNCMKLGVEEAFRRTNEHNCVSCHLPCLVEMNHVFSLNWNTLFNEGIKSIKKYFQHSILQRNTVA